MKTLKNYYLPLGLLLVAVSRLYGIGEASVWYDEAFTQDLIRLPYSGMLYLISHYDFNPPLWELLNKFLFFPGSPIWMYRLLSCAFGMGCIYLAWRLLDQTKGEKPHD